METRYPGEPGILVARIEDRFYIDTSVVNNLILGITRSGKGELLAKTSIEGHQPGDASAQSGHQQSETGAL